MITILRKFTRITNSGKFIPEIDGLRFIAILWVILFHVNGFVIVKTHVAPNAGQYIFNWILYNGEQGVELFFVISGFVVALPFIKQAIDGRPKLSIKSYYLRRLWRLVPPCLIVTGLLFGMHYFVVRKYSLLELSENFLASSVYMSNLIFSNRLPLINPVTWSLEVEMQFYLVAPFFLQYLFGKPTFRDRLVVSGVLYALFVALKYSLHIHIISLLDYGHYFIAGIVLCDMYTNNIRIKILDRNTWLYALLSLAFIIFARVKAHPILDIVYPAVILMFCYTVLINKTIFSKILRNEFLVIVGGMCYSIYLIHYTIISFIGNYAVRKIGSADYMLNFSLNLVVILPFILIISICFFRWFERPFMKFPDRFLSNAK